MAGTSSKHLISGRGSTSSVLSQQELQLPLIEVEKKKLILFCHLLDVPETEPVNKT